MDTNISFLETIGNQRALSYSAILEGRIGDTKICCTVEAGELTNQFFLHITKFITKPKLYMYDDNQKIGLNSPTNLRMKLIDGNCGIVTKELYLDDTNYSILNRLFG